MPSPLNIPFPLQPKYCSHPALDYNYFKQRLKVVERVLNLSFFLIFKLKEHHHLICTLYIAFIGPG